MDKLKILKYFNRIYIDLDPANLTLDYNLLRLLQLAHVTNIPYENLDIIHGIPLSLEPEVLFEKIVEKRRGGYCFELNGLYGWLLSELGFKIKDCMARYLRGETITLENSSASLLTTIVTAGHYAAVILAGQDENTKQPGQKPAGWPLGWARGMAAGQLKNLYPQAWRRMT